MAVIKVRFRESTVEKKCGSLCYRVAHRHQIRQYSTGYKIYPHEWDALSGSILVPPDAGERRLYLLHVEQCMKNDLSLLSRIVSSLEEKCQEFSVGDVLKLFMERKLGNSFFGFVEEVVEGLECIGRVRMGECYASAMRSFKRFRNGEDLTFSEIDSPLIVEFENYLKASNVCANSISFYMRNLRAVYNRAVESGLVSQGNPFRHVFTGVSKTVKRAIQPVEIKKIRALDLTADEGLEYVRDLFLFSFYTRGMSLVDMAFLRKSDVSGGILSYRRKKTGQQLFIKWEDRMQSIVDRYRLACDSPYLLPIIKCPGSNERRQYLSEAHSINRRLKKIGDMAELGVPLTMYVARHSWASIARSKNVPISIISEGMGHDSEQTTQIYLRTLNTSAVDKANDLVFKSI